MLKIPNFLFRTAFLLCLLLFIVFPQSTYAETGNYATSYHVTYTVDDDGLAHAVMNIGLTNLTSKYYASSYKLKIGFTDITNVKASDRTGPITPVLVKFEDGYQIELPFNDKVVGIGNTINFTLAFDLKSIARKNGTVPEISIPATAGQENFADFLITVKTPTSFGRAVITRPTSDNGSLTFSKKQLGKAGVQINFGDKQHYAYNLRYHLKNNNVFPIRTEIALPPTTNYQESIVESISPKPLNVIMDPDGNWLAQYSLAPSQKIEVTVKGKATVHLTPGESALSEGERKYLTAQSPYWHMTPEMKKLAEDLKTPRKIYDYVVSTLSYDFQRRTSTTETRIGAKNILHRKDNALCLEFTDLFIALSRAAGIPARELDGYAFTNNKAERPLSLITDVLHAWPEYYDEAQHRWIMVDPTWGDTTNGMDYFTSLDLDHFTFVIKGKNSSYPVPAGGYKLDDGNIQRDVDISFVNDVEQPEQHISMVPEISEEVLSGFPITGTISVSNTGQGLSHDQSIRVVAATLQPRVQTISVPPIPPGGTVLLDLMFQKTPFLTKGTHTFTIDLADKKITRSVSVSPFLITKWHLIGGIIIAVLATGLFVIAYTTGRIPLFRRKR